MFANGREISGKASGNKSIAAMPDVCMSPPSPPAGPIPIPYPNFSKASDTSSGSKKVKIGRKEVGLKNKSDYKKSKGDEAATRNFGMGIVTHKIQGKTKHAAWSFDVKIEKQNVIRHLDLTTHNHGSASNIAVTADAAKLVEQGKMDDACKALSEKNNEKRQNNGHETETSTITHGVYTPPNGETPKNLWACSREAADKYGNGRVTGLKKIESSIGWLEGNILYNYSFDETNLCKDATEGDKGFKYDRDKCHQYGGCGMPQTHTESKIIEKIFSGTYGKPPTKKNPAKLLIAIDWNVKCNNQGENIDAFYYSDDRPCSDCKRLICAAIKCGLEVELCQGENGNKKAVPQKEEDCPDDLSKSPKKIKAKKCSEVKKRSYKVEQLSLKF